MVVVDVAPGLVVGVGTDVVGASEDVVATVDVVAPGSVDVELLVLVVVVAPGSVDVLVVVGRVDELLVVAPG